MLKFAKQPILVVALAVLLAPAFLLSQSATGIPPFGSFGGGPFDTVNLGNLNVHFVVPVLNKAGRVTPFYYNLSYDSSVWTPVTASGTTSWQPVGNWGWRGVTEVATGFISYKEALVKTCPPLEGHSQLGFEYLYSSFAYHDTFGVTHAFPGTGTLETGTCGTDAAEINSLATDGSGYTLSFYTSNGDTFTSTVTSRGGKVITAPLNAWSGSANATDANGNQFTVNTSGQFFDTLSSTTPVLTVTGSGTPTSPLTFTYPAPSDGASSCNPITDCASYTMNFKQYTVATDFGVSGVTEYSPLSTPLVSSIKLPDGSSYTFTYEKTPGSCTPLSGTYSTNCVTGRIASVSLPTGGTVSYKYTGGNNGIESDGSTAGLTRTLSPGGEWQYTRALVSGKPGTGSTWTTTVIDPNTNYTVINSAEDGSTSNPTYNFYETQRQVYQGTVSASNLLATSIRCYNANYASCATKTVSSPITQTDVYSQLPNGSSRLSEVVYNTFGLVTDDKEYTYPVTTGSAPGTTNLVRETAISYASLSNNIYNSPASVTVYGWTSGGRTTLASTTYTYDQGTPTATSDTPQHVSITGSRGNLTTLTTSTTSTATLVKTITYYDTGNPSVATDVNGAQTTYVYGSGSCGNSFATTIDEPLSLSRSITWNCTGGVSTQVTDENGNDVKSNYTDPDFWRPANVYDQENNETTINYIGETAVEAAQNFNGGKSVSDSRTTVDGFGRTILSQRLQGPGATNYDTTETDYNNLGQPHRSTMPFSAAAGGTNSTAPGSTTTYDALGRVLSVTDADGGTVSYTYNNNDVLQQASGAQTFQKQLEYDGLGRLTSVCEISSTLPGVGTCGQNTSKTGYWTKYTYDALGHLLTTTQNAQAATGSQQTRTFVYDMVGRVISETNPESGTNTYIYDSWSAGGCGWTSQPGDLMAKVNSDGSSVCYVHDAFHRLTRTGTSATPNTCRSLIYDSVSNALQAQPPNSTFSNLAGRLVEAETDNCTVWPPTKAAMITDEWFSYSPRGETTDIYELTPHSGGVYYHTTASFWPTGTVETLSGIPGVPTINYGANGAGLDGEGRVTQVTAASGTNPVTNVTYSTSSTTNPLGALTQVTFGSTDSDSFTYDPNTGRMSTYQLSVNSAVDQGTLTWNTNGTLNKLAISDQIPGTSDTQTCNYLYDDVSRLSSANCGSVWAQTFTYDAFGNITKSGSISWMPNYTNTANQYQSGWNGVSYDASGNLLNDTFNTYTWDGYNDLASVNGQTITYDALGRMVENQNGAWEFVYPPFGGAILASMSGQNLGAAIVPLPANGAFAVYNSAGLVQYNHPDWIGSARMFSNPGRGAIPAMAYAPFGEGYAEGADGYVQFTATGNEWTVADSGNGTGSLVDFLYRRYNPTQGRWISPDPAGLGAVTLANPQSWNRYAYVMNRPLNLVDPRGLKPVVLQCPLDTCSPFGGGGSGGMFIPSVGGIIMGDDEFDTIAGTLTPMQVYLNCVELSYNCDAQGNPQEAADNGMTPSTGCSVSASCGPTANTQGFSHCTVTVNQNGNYTAYDGGPTGSVWNSTLQVYSGPTGPPGPNTFYISNSCSMATCVPTVAQNINNSNMWYSFLFQNSNTAASMMLNQCGANVSLPVWGPQ